MSVSLVSPALRKTRVPDQRSILEDELHSWAAAVFYDRDRANPKYGMCASFTSDAAPAPINSNWSEMGSKDPGSRRRASLSLLLCVGLLCVGLCFPPSPPLHLVSTLLSLLRLTVFLCLLNALLTEPPLTLQQLPFLLIHLQKDLLDVVEKLWL